MKAADVWRLLILAALWGGSFLFMRVAGPEFGPLPLVELRLAIAALILLPLLSPDRGGRAIVWKNWRPLMIVGVMNSALPFSLLAFAMLHLIGGFASILNATTPFFAAIIAYFWLGMRLSRIRLLGLLIGFGGVVVLVWGKVDFQTGGSGLSVCATLGAACSYGFAASYIKRRLGRMDAQVIAAGSLFWGAAALLPLALLSLPAALPSPKAWGMAISLGILSTAVAYRFYFRLLEVLGPTGAVTVTFLVPAFAILWGAIFLKEPVEGRMIVGGLIVLIGTGLTTGLLAPRLFRWQRQAIPPVEGVGGDLPD